MTTPASTHRLAFVVPTRNRRHDLFRMLSSIQEGTAHPSQIVIVDGGEELVADVAAAFRDLPIEYQRVYPPSLSQQRNAGMARLRPDITLAGYLDDDLVLEREAVAGMLRFWDAAGSDVGGAAFNIVSDRRPRATALKSVFLLDSARRGAVLRSGYNTMICPVTETLDVDWLFGGATVWRREVIREFAYDEWFAGTGYLEDLDYSYRVRKKYRLVVVAGARLDHLNWPIRREMNYTLGRWQAMNRNYFVRKHRELSVPGFWWSMVGQICVNAAKALVERDPALARRAGGNIAGAIAVAMGRRERVGGILR
jgi:glycosyltransferase involved in cell wall biosynthesis